MTSLGGTLKNWSKSLQRIFQGNRDTGKMPSPNSYSTSSKILQDVQFNQSNGSRSNQTKTVDRLNQNSSYPKFPSRAFRLIAEYIKNTSIITKKECIQGLEDIYSCLEVPKYRYKNIRQLCRFQQILLALWKHTLKQLEQEELSEAVHEASWRILIRVIGREEFNFPLMEMRMNFSSSDEEEHVTRSESIASYSQNYLEEYQLEINTVCSGEIRLYLLLLLASFRYVCEKIENLIKQKKKNLSLGDINDYSSITAIVFLRIPYIQEKILDGLFNAYYKKKWEFGISKEQISKRKNKLELTFQKSIEHWNPTKYQDDKFLRRTSCEMKPSFDQPRFEDNPNIFAWQQLTPKILSDQIELNIYDIQSLLQWNAEFFFAFVVALSEHVSKISSKDLIWNQVPGYPLLTRIALHLLHQSNWQQYWDACGEIEKTVETKDNEYFLITSRGLKTILDLSSKMLHNQQLVTSFLLATYEATNLYDSRSVGRCLYRLGQMISSTREILGSELLSFGDPVFIFGMKMIIQSEDFETLKKLLLFLYQYLDSFAGQLRQSVLKICVFRHFYLFLHWHPQVRSYYHHLLVYKICRYARPKIESFTDQLLLRKLSENQHYYNHIPASQELSHTALMIDKSNWKAFDACIGLICKCERSQAQERNNLFQFELTQARNRSISYQKLKDIMPNNNIVDLDNEKRPVSFDAKMETAIEDMDERPPYYLRYLLSHELEALDDLCEVLAYVKYNPCLQVYASHSLKEYTVLLQDYYTKYDNIAENKSSTLVEPPALGFY